MKRIGKKRVDAAVELNITAFMNLMVILVPFLLITAVFSRITVLELNLPSLDAKDNQQQKIKLQLELVLRDKSFDIQDANLGVIKSFSRSSDDTNWKGFTDILVEIKSRFPDENNITLLLEPGINYKTLITVMDHVRSADVVQFTTVETVELFPNISIGDAEVYESPAAVINNQPATTKTGIK
ncbi:MAG: biopolymer transporter ExbD [Gammaproteobacteria bacterium]|nr:biopolymer transporter ExbD [Gammaproteobacteria bacterium]MCW8988252.1 biopolymer transporter ExbD [Gammaproteobacteria bacterium]